MQNIFLGVDTLELVIDMPKKNCHVTAINIFINKEHEKYITIRPRSITKEGYIVSVCLPKMVRSDNIKGFGMEDVHYLPEITIKLSKIFRKVFDVGLDEVFVKKVEINVTVFFPKKKDVECIMNLLLFAFLQEDDSIPCVIHNEQGEQYISSSQALKTVPKVESFRTKRLSNKRFSWKVYDKSLEQGITAKGILRIEQVHNKESFTRAKVPLKFDSFLTESTMIKLCKIFQSDFKKNLILKWKKNNFLENCINLIAEDLKIEKPSTVIKIHSYLIGIDFVFFKKACYKHYDNSKSAKQTIRRIKKLNTIEMNQGAIAKLVRIFRIFS